MVRLRDERGAMLALRLRPDQVRTLANGLGGIVAPVESRLEAVSADG